MTHNQHCNLYISSCCKDGGIYRYELLENGILKFKDKTPLDRPMYTVLNNNKMYVLLRQPFENSAESGLVSFDIGNDGKLINKSNIESTKGEVACHLCVDRKKVYAVNYISGSVIMMPEKLIVHNGKSVNAKRQTSPHTHFVTVTPDDRYILVTDLGTDKVVTYNKNLDFICDFKIKDGNGPRHIAFSEDGKHLFVANELSSTVTMCGYCDGKLTYIDEYSTLPKDFDCESSVAAIRCYGNRVYVSNRGHNSVACFEIKNNELDLSYIVSCGGKSPRDFDVIGDFIVCTNEISDNITVIDMKNKMNTVCDVKAEAPLCITYLRGN